MPILICLRKAIYAILILILFILYVQIFGLLSAEVKIIAHLTEEEIQKWVQQSGITLVKQIESDHYTVHGSWKSLLRARSYLVSKL